MFSYTVKLNFDLEQLLDTISSMYDEIEGLSCYIRNALSDFIDDEDLLDEIEEDSEVAARELENVVKDNKEAFISAYLRELDITDYIEDPTLVNIEEDNYFLCEYLERFFNYNITYNNDSIEATATIDVDALNTCMEEEDYDIEELFYKWNRSGYGNVDYNKNKSDEELLREYLESLTNAIIVCAAMDFGFVNK